MLDHEYWTGDTQIQRFHEAPRAAAEDGRDEYEHDRARIIHSVHFRRLQGKTQIFFPAWADFVRTRVTHSIETSQIGRALALNASVPPSLVEAACLAHDLGHPPFGHTGEDALNRVMDKHGGFEGNAQSFRILTRLERKAKAFPGLNLCRETLLATIKYPYRPDAQEGKFLYEDDVSDYERWLYGPAKRALVGKRTRAEKRAPQNLPRSLPCQLMDWADDVAYSVHDLEDGIVSGFLRPAILTEDEIVSRIHDNVRGPAGGESPSPGTVLDILKELQDLLRPWTPVLSRATVREATRYYINKFVTAVEIRSSEPAATSFDFDVIVPEDARTTCEVLKTLVFEFIIKDHRVQAFTYKGGRIVSDLFDALWKNVSKAAEPNRYLLFPHRMRAALEAASRNQSHLARLIADEVASMTEGQAIRLHQSLFEAAGGSPFEPG